jgi:hypothetical protein
MIPTFVIPIAGDYNCIPMTNTKTNISGRWHQSDAQIFWGEIAPYDHVVQIYENDQVFIDLLAGYTSGGIRNGDSVIVIASAAHIRALNENLKLQGFDPFYLTVKEQYIPLDAEETLSRFMVNGWPDENLFNHTVGEVLAKARRNNRQVRAFGEMVALLWAKGQTGATVQLEHLWNNFREKSPFGLFCAYPKSGFTENPVTSIMTICKCHNKLITGMQQNSNDIAYHETEFLPQHAV